MSGLLLFLLLFAAGTFFAYRCSSASKIKRRMQDALSPLEQLYADVRRLREGLQHEVEFSFTQYIQGIHSARLKTIPLGESKRYATGMRLQALKDAGFRTVADLQGWNEYRIAQLRGVGPKSASAIIQAVAIITAKAKATPIDHPAPPFSGCMEGQLMQALYRQRWFNSHIAGQSNAFAKDLILHKSTRDEVAKGTSFSRWLWKFGCNETIRNNVNRGNAMIAALADVCAQSMRDKLLASLDHGRTVCANRVPVGAIIQDFKENREFYDSWLSSRFGTVASKAPAKSISQQAEQNVPSAPDLVHIEFGRPVPGPPPPPTGGNQIGPFSAKGPTTRPEEQLTSVHIGSNSGERPAEFALPSAPPRSTSTNLRWLTRGESFQIQGRTLLHGFVYVGKGIGFERRYTIDPALSVKTGATTSRDTSAGGYFSYADFDPEQRSRYLDWLAAGAPPSTESGFGMLYFYGIERRFLDLIQGRGANSVDQELEHLLEESYRIGSFFPGAVAQCCQRLADLAAVRAFNGTSVPELPKAWGKTDELPFIMRYGIGCFMRDGRPIPAEWAFRWALLEPTIYLRTPATRCPREFESAFTAAYRDKFGEGLIVPANKTKLKLVYQPGWPMHIGPEIKHEFPGIPDIAALSGPQQTIKTLVEQSTAMIEGYSRYIGRHPEEAGQFMALLNIPPRFWPAADQARWQKFLASIVLPMEPRILEVLLRELGYTGDPAVVKIEEIVANLNRALVGFEPEIHPGSRRPKPSDMIVVFPLESGADANRITNGWKPSLTVSLAACIALADDHASGEEAAAVDSMITGWQHLHTDLRTRLRAKYRLQVRQSISLASLKSHFTSLTADGRLNLARTLSSLATVDGNIAVTEVKLLERVYKALELEPQMLYAHLYGNQGTRALASPPSSQTHSHVLDAARLAALRQETEQVSALLAGVFEGEETPNAVPSQAIDAIPSSEIHPKNELVLGLSAKHQRFLAELLQKPSWTRSELEATAVKMGVMLDGALECINEVAFDLVGEPLAEGSDPIYVQQNILENAK